jgi:hypothetical protein
MKRWIIWTWAGCLWAGPAFADSQVTLTIGAEAGGYAIPRDFTGVSISTEIQVASYRGSSHP